VDFSDDFARVRLTSRLHAPDSWAVSHNSAFDDGVSFLSAVDSECLVCGAREGGFRFGRACAWCAAASAKNRDVFLSCCGHDHDGELAFSWDLQLYWVDPLPTCGHFLFHLLVVVYLIRAVFELRLSSIGQFLNVY
jgi:hypothetical protein